MKTIYLKGDIGWEITADKIREKIDLKSSEKLQVIVNSPGGFVIEAYEIYDLFKQYKGQIEMVIMPYAASAASYVIMAGDKISAFKNSIWMAHRVLGIVIGDADEVLQQAGIMRNLEDIIIEAYQTRIKMTKDEMLTALKNELWLVGWEKLTEIGLIDNVIDSLDEVELSDDEKQDIDKSIKESETNLSGILKMRMSKTESRMKNENDRIKSMYERIAAKFEINPAKPVEINSTEDKKMKLEDYLKTDPEAKADFDAVLETAKAQVRTEMTNTLNQDRERLAKVLDLEKVPLSQAARDAIVGETTITDYMEARIKEQQDKRETKVKSPFDKLVANQIPGEQDPKGKKEQEGKEDLEKFDKESEELAQKHFGGKK